jgi:hypothetical protein
MDPEEIVKMTAKLRDANPPPAPNSSQAPEAKAEERNKPTRIVPDPSKDNWRSLFMSFAAKVGAALKLRTVKRSVVRPSQLFLKEGVKSDYVSLCLKPPRGWSIPIASGIPRAGGRAVTIRFPLDVETSRAIFKGMDVKERREGKFKSSLNGLTALADMNRAAVALAKVLMEQLEFKRARAKALKGR